MSETATEELVNTLNDPEEPLTPEVEEAAIGVVGVLRNVFKSSSIAIETSDYSLGKLSSSKVK